MQDVGYKKADNLGTESETENKGCWLPAPGTRGQLKEASNLNYLSNLL